MKYLVLVLALAFNLIACGERYRVRETLETMPPRAFVTGQKKYTPLVRIRVEGHAHCSGVVISSNYVLTAGHCVAGYVGKEMEINPGNAIKVAIKATGAGYDMRRDFGVILGDFSDFSIAKIDAESNGFLKLSSPMAVAGIGFPGGQSKPTITHSMVPVTYFMFSVLTMGQAYPGMSGGPVLNIETGEVIGVFSATAPLPNGAYGTLVSTLVGLYGTMGIEPIQGE